MAMRVKTQLLLTKCLHIKHILKVSPLAFMTIVALTTINSKPKQPPTNSLLN